MFRISSNWRTGESIVEGRYPNLIFDEVVALLKSSVMIQEQRQVLIPCSTRHRSPSKSISFWPEISL